MCVEIQQGAQPEKKSLSEEEFNLMDSVNMFSQTVQFVQINIYATNVPTRTVFVSLKQPQHTGATTQARHTTNSWELNIPF